MLVSGVCSEPPFLSFLSQCVRGEAIAAGILLFRRLVERLRVSVLCKTKGCLAQLRPSPRGWPQEFRQRRFGRFGGRGSRASAE